MNYKITEHEDFKYFEQKTDPRYTKAVNVGKRSFTNIDAYYLMQELTKAFGLYGKGFGVRDIVHGEKELGETILVISRGTFFFPDGEFPITTAGKLCYMTKPKSGVGYLMIDEDIYKKNETNLLSKGASKIGFGSDIYMGKFEDANYVNEAWGETEINQEQRQEITKLCGVGKVKLEDVLNEFSIKKLTDLKQEEFQRALAFINTANAKR